MVRLKTGLPGLESRASRLRSTTREGTEEAAAREGARLFARQSGELFDRQVAGTNKAAQRSAGNFPVIGHGQRCHVACLDQDHVAATLPDHLPAVSGEGFDDVASAE